MTEMEQQRAEYLGICMAKDTIHRSNPRAAKALQEGLTGMKLTRGWWGAIGEAFWKARKEMHQRERSDKRDK